MDIGKVFELVEPAQYYEHVLGKLPSPDGKGNVMLKCCFHDDWEKSLSINVSMSGGIYRCFGCNAKGNMIQFHQTYYGIDDPKSAAEDMLERLGISADTKIHVVDEAQLTEWHRELFTAAHKRHLKYLIEERGIKDSLLRRFKIGWDNRKNRVTIPIRDTTGKIVNVRRWLPPYYRKTKADEAAKMIGLRNHNQNQLFPIASLQEQEIILCEGELDALVLLGHGFNAITSTGGVQSLTAFVRGWYRLFKDKDVVLMLDNDEAGRDAASKHLDGFYPVARSIRTVYFNSKIDYKDVTDVWKEAPDDFESRVRLTIDNTPPFYRTQGKVHEVNLYQAASANMVNKPIKVRAIVAGREDTPLAVPKRVRCICDSAKKNCAGCPARRSEDGVVEEVITPDNPYFIDLIVSPQREHKSILKEMFDVSCRTPNIEVTEVQNIEEVRLIPEIDMSDSYVEYTIRQAYVARYGLRYNETYEFVGTTTINPKNNVVTHIFSDYEKVNKIDDQLESNELIMLDGQEATVQEHLSVFQVGEGENVYSKLNDIYRDLEDNITLVIDRKDVLRAIDLTMHSAIAFNFDDEPVMKGWLDSLIIGDTATGKSKTINRYRDHVRAGEKYSGENISKVGIIGGYINMSGSNRSRFVLGVWPLNDGRCVIIDEGSGLTEDAFKDLTMLRDHGIAESTKQGQRNKYPARVRFCMISNPPGRADGGENSMQSYAFGVLAIRDLIQQDADISRFDMAVVAAGDEVDTETINRKHKSTVPHVYTSDKCNLLIRWAWTRKSTDIKFTPSAVKVAYELADEMGKQYDSSLPLVLGQSQRMKIARVAVAIAMRLYSTTDGQNVQVTQEHVEAAYKILNDDFRKPSMGYHTYSAAKRRENSLPNPKGVKELLDRNSFMLTECLIANRVFQKKTLEDYTGEPREIVNNLFRELIRYRCIQQSRQYYKLTPAFLTFLKSYEHPERDTYYKDMEGDVDEESFDG